MKWIKRGIATLLIVALFIVAALVAATIYIDPNDYKDEITAAVAKHTGRTLNIDGDIELSVFPWIGLELNKVSLDNPKGFTDKQFAAMGRLNIKAAFLPLLKLQVRIRTIELIGLNVSAEILADGKSNWDELLAMPAESGLYQPRRQRQPAEPESVPTLPPATPSDPTMPEIYVGQH